MTGGGKRATPTHDGREKGRVSQGKRRECSPRYFFFRLYRVTERMATEKSKEMMLNTTIGTEFRYAP
jgi:hypothetical protein